MCKLNKRTPENQQIKSKLKGKILKYLRTNENGNNILKHVECCKAVEKFIAINAHIKKTEKNLDPTFYTSKTRERN